MSRGVFFICTGHYIRRTEEQAYDALNRLTQMGSAKNGALSNYAYTLGAAGNRLTVAELSGSTVNYAYCALIG